MTKEFTVSLLVPCFNAENYLGDFIENMSRQTRLFDEVIFYDDASTDKTAEILSKQTFGRVIYGKFNQGPSIARNILLRESKSKLIHFHDVDDWLEPTFLEETLKALTPEWDVILTNIRVLDRETGETRHIHDYSGLTNGEDATAFFLTHCCYPINGLYRREILEKVGGFRETLLRDEDPDLHIRLAYAGARIRIISEPLAINRFGSGTYSSISYIACWREHLKALHYYKQELPKKYYEILRLDSAKMVGLSASCGDLQLAYGYLSLCESLGGERDFLQASSQPMKMLIKLLGSRNALNLRYGYFGAKMRKMLPGRIG